MFTVANKGIIYIADPPSFALVKPNCFAVIGNDKIQKNYGPKSKFRILQPVL